MIDPDQHIAAAFYRNTIIHYFVNGAIAEVALLDEPSSSFWEEVLTLRDLLKFEFFFPPRSRSSRRSARKSSGRCRDGILGKTTKRVGQHGRADVPAPGIGCSVPSSRPIRWWRMSWCNTTPTWSDEKQLLQECLALGSSTGCNGGSPPRSRSQLLFGNGLKLAANRGLLERGSNEQRLAFARQLAEVLDRVDRIAALAAARRAGLTATSRLSTPAESDSSAKRPMIRSAT